ncbi:hypothetical protein EDB85DRAFT_1895083 [Lactarius pseudohatsudake]|nr:hypothetical protein EDB85DRAFT_1895083 [Lactarius pseudohatsudake]
MKAAKGGCRAEGREKGRRKRREMHLYRLSHSFSDNSSGVVGVIGSTTPALPTDEGRGGVYAVRPYCPSSGVRTAPGCRTVTRHGLSRLPDAPKPGQPSAQLPCNNMVDKLKEYWGERSGASSCAAEHRRDRWVEYTVYGLLGCEAAQVIANGCARFRGTRNFAELANFVGDAVCLSG